MPRALPSVRLGRPWPVSAASSPAANGALPMATRVPSATPVRATAAKKQSW